MRANFIWQLPHITSSQTGAMKALGYIVNDWNLAGIWSGATGRSYTSATATRSGGSNLEHPDRLARLRAARRHRRRYRVGVQLGSVQAVQHRGFQGPLADSVGLESGSGYLKGCFISSLDLSISRVIRLDTRAADPAAARPVQRVQSGRDHRPQHDGAVREPGGDHGDHEPAVRRQREPDPVAVVPRDAGFGVATAYQTPRAVQVQIRFSF